MQTTSPITYAIVWECDDWSVELCRYGTKEALFGGLARMEQYAGGIEMSQFCRIVQVLAGRDYVDLGAPYDRGTTLSHTTGGTLGVVAP